MAFTKIVAAGINTGSSYTFQDLNTVGVVTAATVQVGSATTVHTTGIDLGSGNITSHNINSTGIITATSFVGPVTGNITGDITATSGTFSGNVSIAGTLTYEDVTNIDSVGIITAQSGIRVTSGSVGIGTDNPATKLEVRTGDTVVNALRVRGNTQSLNFGVNETAGGSFVFESLNQALRFGTNDTERLRITSAGNVGIGTDNPSGILEVLGGNGNQLYLDNAGERFTQINLQHSGAQNGALWLDDTDSMVDLYANTSHGIRFKTGGDNERLRITSDGKVGINDISPAYQLSINGTGAVRNEIVCTDNNGAGAGVYFRTMNGGSMVSNATIRTDNAGNFQIFTGTSSDSEKLRITSAGRVGINNTNPHYLLHLKSNHSSERVDLHMTNDTTGHNSDDGVQFGYQNIAGAYIWNFENTPIYFGTNNTERLRILANGTLRGGTDGSSGGSTLIENKYSDPHILNILGSMYSSGNTTLTYGLRPKAGSSGYVSSFSNFTGYRSAITIGQGTFEFLSTTSALNTAVGNDVSPVVRMKVDPNGYVTKQYQPAFLAYHQASDLNYGVGSTLAFPYTLYNIGNHYNTSNSTFTAPVAGRYLFSVNAQAHYQGGVSGVPRAYWKINGNNVANAIHLRGSDNLNTGGGTTQNAADGLEQRSQTVIFNLSANDTVKVVVGQNRWDLFGANSFTGYLVG